MGRWQADTVSAGRCPSKRAAEGIQFVNDVLDLECFFERSNSIILAR
jgi:hypothetical protein